jgi:anti-sigma B factor antagonist
MKLKRDRFEGTDHVGNQTTGIEQRMKTMLNIEKKKDGPELTVALAGRLDTVTAPELEKELKVCLEGVTMLSFDMAELEYISSAGLRVLLSAQKLMSRQGEIKVFHVNETIMEIFEVTGFSDYLTIE